MLTDRRQGRILAMQALCQWDVQREESPDLLESFLADCAVADRDDDKPQRRAGRSAIRYARSVVTAYWRDRAAIDAQISAVAEKWDLSRISSVERNLMRVAIVELLAGGIPPKVVLDEGVEIGRTFGGADSPRFVNGVLDAVWRRMHEGKESGG